MIVKRFKLREIFVFVAVHFLVHPLLGQDAERQAALSLIDYANYWINSGDRRAMLYCLRASAYYDLDSSLMALRDYSTAIEIDPITPGYFSGRAGVYFALEKYRESVADYSHAISLGHPDLLVFVYRAWAYEELDDLSSAEKDYTKVITSDEYHELALFHRAKLYEIMPGKSDMALADWNKLIDRFPYPKYYYERGRFYLSLNNFRLSVKDLEAAISFKEEKASYYADLGYAYGMLGNDNKALEAFKRAQAIDDQEPALYWRRGLFYLHKKDKNRACRDLRKSELLGIDTGDDGKLCR